MKNRLIAMVMLMSILAGCEEGGLKKQMEKMKEDPVAVGQEGVKIFYAYFIDGDDSRPKVLQNEINAWLKENTGKIEIIERAHTGTGNRNSIYMHYKRLK